METIDDFSERTGADAGPKLKVDLIVQTLLLGIAAMGAAVQKFEITFFAFYCGIGGYQLVTSFVHLRFKKHSTGRILYWPQLVIHAFCFLSLYFMHDPINMLLVILFTTAFSGFYYYILTIVEYAQTRK